jgi:hypothetical protein
MCIKKIWNYLFPKKLKCDFNATVNLVEMTDNLYTPGHSGPSGQSGVPGQNICWAILEHVPTGIKYHSTPYDNIDKFTTGEIVCDIISREYLILGWTTVKPIGTIINVFKCNFWDDI